MKMIQSLNKFELRFKWQQSILQALQLDFFKFIYADTLNHFVYKFGTA